MIFFQLISRLKLNNGNFQIELPEHDESTIHPSIAKDLIERKAYLIWESKGKPTSSPQQQKVVLLIHSMFVYPILQE